MQVTIAVDVQGADRGIAEVVAGAMIAASEGIAVRLFGPRPEIERSLGAAQPPNISIVHTDEFITNFDDPATAARGKRDASVVLAAKAVGDGEAGALVSAGPTGALLAASLFNLKRIKGVKRPAIAAILPNAEPGGKSLLLDAGANVDCTPEMLVQFATLGVQFSIRVLGVRNPRVGLLSIGEEDKKGNDRVVEAGRLLAMAVNSHHFEYLGNVEGRDITAGTVDVTVTDGFTGNVALKSIEGAARATMQRIAHAIKSDPIAKVGGLLAKRKLLQLRSEIDPNTTGGALLLGLKKVSVVAHGSSTAEGIAAAIRLARSSVDGDVTGHMTSAIAELTESKSVAPDAVTVGAADDA